MKLLKFTSLLCLALLTLPGLAYVYDGTRWPERRAVFHVDIGGADGLWNRAFEGAMAEWSQQTIFEFRIIREFGSPCNDPNSSSAFNGVAFSDTVCGDSWGGTTLAITQSYSSGSTFSQTSILFNRNLDWSVYQGPGQAFAFEFRRVALHELGHALGLDHESRGVPIMHPTNNDVESLTSDDIDGVAALYATANTGGSGSGSGGGGGGGGAADYFMIILLLSLFLAVRHNGTDT